MFLQTNKLLFLKQIQIIKKFTYCTVLNEKIDQNQFINIELKYGAHNYNPLPVVISKAQGIFFLIVLINKIFKINYKKFLSCKIN